MLSVVKSGRIKEDVVGKKIRMLKLDKKRKNEDKEIEFELDHLKSLSTKERFQMMFGKTQEMLQLLNRHGYRKNTQIIKRTDC